jgi:hypothetical protein
MGIGASLPAILPPWRVVEVRHGKRPNKGVLLYTGPSFAYIPEKVFCQKNTEPCRLDGR